MHFVLSAKVVDFNVRSVVELGLGNPSSAFVVCSVRGFRIQRNPNAAESEEKWSDIESMHMRRSG